MAKNCQKLPKMAKNGQKWPKMAKNGHVHEGGKVMPLPPNFFSVNSYDLKSVSFQFCNDIFITFEMPGVAYSRPVDKIHISLLFRPSVIRGP